MYVKPNKCHNVPASSKLPYIGTVVTCRKRFLRAVKRFYYILGKPLGIAAKMFTDL